MPGLNKKAPATKTQRDALTDPGEINHKDRELVHFHQLPGTDDLDSRIDIEVVDLPGDGGACHEYEVVVDGDSGGTGSTLIEFQKGPLKEAGVNGLSNEALLAIVKHRLHGFQDGPGVCRDNARALAGVNDALTWLHHRTKQRANDGVEGTSAT